MALTATLLLACASDDLVTETPAAGCTVALNQDTEGNYCDQLAYPEDCCPEDFVFVGYDWEGSVICLE